MANRRMTTDEIASVMELFEQVKSSLDDLAKGDQELLFAMRRRLYVRLSYEERNTPAYRTKLKASKLKQQSGKCAICGKSLDLKGSELDRTRAVDGYTEANTRLVHHECHVSDQASKGFTDT